MDDEIRERHGVKCSGGKPFWTATETDNAVAIPEQIGERLLTPKQARYMAGRLYRLARRVEKRQADG